MVGVAQLVEHLVVVQEVAGSSPVTHPGSRTPSHGRENASDSVSPVAQGTPQYPAGQLNTCAASSIGRAADS